MRESERKRLVELFKEIYPKTRYIPMEECQEKTADFLLDNGIVVPPCKVGDVVYFVIEDDETDEKYITSQRVNDVSTRGLFVSSSTIEENCDSFEPYSELGKTVFTSREEAQKSLGGEQ